MSAQTCRQVTSDLLPARESRGHCHDLTVQVGHAQFPRVTQGFAFRGEAQQPGLSGQLVDDVAERLNAELVPCAEQ